MLNICVRNEKKRVPRHWAKPPSFPIGILDHFKECAAYYYVLDDILSADNSKLFLVRQKSADVCGILTEFFKNDCEIPMGILIGKCGCLDLLLRQEKSKHACALGIILRFKWSHQSPWSQNRRQKHRNFCGRWLSKHIFFVKSAISYFWKIYTYVMSLNN